MKEYLSDLDIQALIDDELSPREAEHVHALIQQQEWAQQRYEELKEQKKLLKNYYQKIQH
ncbi:MAG: hypothetical protein CMH26_00460 [Micavibrio sp.]|nr:hypothetical protein [Micavibrio sp.]|tara:strand:- start:579 stop:758 length:180 start_codon:yes stop_codon:yes gene_type:complete